MDIALHITVTAADTALVGMLCRRIEVDLIQNFPGSLRGDLCFTGDEIWQAMPHREGDDARNVLFNDMNKPFAEYALDEAAMAKWEKIIAVRTAVNGVLEAARAEKKIGKALEAHVVLVVDV